MVVVGDARLRKTDRLRKRGEYLLVQTYGRKYHLEHLLVFVHPSAQRGRVGITVSAKVGNAVARNRVKRWLREVVRRIRAELPGNEDVVLVAKRSAATATMAKLCDELLGLGRRLSRG